MDVPDQLREMFFPFGGVFVSCAFDQQPPGTTPIAFNTRAYEPSASRRRGGARPGLTKHFTDQLPAGLQNMGLVVSTDPSAQIGTFDADDPSYPTYPIVPIGGLFGPAFPAGHFTPVVGGGPNTDAIDDPSSDGTGNPLLGTGGNAGRNQSPFRRIRRGGQGRSVSRHHRVPTPPPAPGNIIYIQSNQDSFALSATPQTISLLAVDGFQPVAVGDLLILCISTFTAGVSLGVTDDIGTVYTLATAIGSGSTRLLVYYGTAIASGDVNLTFTPSAGTMSACCLIDLRGSLPSLLDGTVTRDSPAGGNPRTTGLVPISGTNRLVLGAFANVPPANNFLSPLNGYTTICFLGVGGQRNLFVFYKEAVSATEEVTGTPGTAGNPYVAIGSSWRGT